VGRRDACALPVCDIQALEAGHATAEDNDTGMVFGCAHPMGPLKLADPIGPDTLEMNKLGGHA
jgi:3-hydroxyacyl-CoA dehydrogenase